jgi:hypothetical protein
MSTRETTGRYEMLWDCAGCGATGLLGLTHRHCPACGNVQDPTRRYYPPEGSEVAVGDHPYHGADKVCPACDSPNAGIATFCTTCGTDLSKARSAVARGEQLTSDTDDARKARDEHAARKAAERDAAARAHAAASGVNRPPPPSAEPPSGGGGGGGKKILIVAVLVAVCGGLFALFGWKKEAAVEVTGHAWSRSIQVEELRAVADSAWKDQVPAGAYDVRNCREAQRDTQKVADGETCTDKRVDKADGSFEKVRDCTPKYRDEPVYDTKCDYSVQRWTVADTLRAEGSALTPAPTWPAAPATTGSGLGARRPGSRAETYTVRFKDPQGAALDCDVDEAKWGSLAVGSRWKAQVGVVTGALDCSALQPAK